MSQAVVTGDEFLILTEVTVICECCERTLAGVSVMDLTDGETFQVCSQCAQLASAAVT